MVLGTGRNLTFSTTTTSKGLTPTTNTEDTNQAEHSARELSAEAKHPSWFQQSQQSAYSSSRKFFIGSSFRYKCGCNVQETLGFSGKE
ncbi:hypothetical protein F2Q70_00025977 [Brassica cretica]|uniref:Uncharacterized protein n=1 Tax=Brassica cretica TaxID=69181 RepID=A0A8S9LGR0_BRACR|nr:hypothetical protein F2Q70_00025977 [Brassica cretica]